MLNRTARRLNEDYEKRHLAKTPQELRAFVGQLGGLQNEHMNLRLREFFTRLFNLVRGGEGGEGGIGWEELEKGEERGRNEYE